LEIAMIKFRLGIGVAAVILASVALAAVDAVTIKVSPKEGDVLKYKQVAKLDVQGMQIEFTATATRKVVKVEASGNYSIKEETTDLKMNGMDVPEGSGPGSSTSTIGARGELVKMEGEHVDESAYRAANLEMFYVPDKPVSEGDSWTCDIKADK